MLTALIMAGGRGTRFWPASTEDKPKQFLSLTTDKTMIQETVRRLLTLIDMDHIFICTGAKYKELCLEQLPQLPERNIIVEPTGRNTAPCILLSTLYINQIYPSSNIIVLPSDAMVTNEEEQLRVFDDANKFIEGKEGIITIGITPNRPEIGYGYIHFLETVETVGTHDIKVVKEFKEKPDVDTAKEYLADGHYLWNAGMFMFGTEFMKNEFAKYATETYNTLISLPGIEEPSYMEELEKKYKECESISVDFAIMEKTDKLFVVPADFGWDDVGSWMALGRYLNSDDNGNITKGNNRIFNAKNNTIISTTKEVVVLDADDLLIIETEERIVVGKKDSLSKVHELRNKLV
jgi:mannose-1-phosphate guanylyltransferase